MKHLSLLTLAVILLFGNFSFAEENRGFNLSGLLKFNKAEERSKADTYIPVEEKKKKAVQLEGSAGPKMPAVPAGAIKKEVILSAAPLPKEFIKKQHQQETPLPPVTVNYNPKIPYVSLIFQNHYQQNLEPAHMDVLKTSMQDMKKGFYRGKVQVKSFSDKDQKVAMDRAQKIREYMLKNGVSLIDLDVQAFSNSTQGNTVHIFLLGEK